MGSQIAKIPNVVQAQKKIKTTFITVIFLLELVRMILTTIILKIKYQNTLNIIICYKHRSLQ